MEVDIQGQTTALKMVVLVNSPELQVGTMKEVADAGSSCHILDIQEVDLVEALEEEALLAVLSGHDGKELHTEAGQQENLLQEAEVHEMDPGKRNLL